MNKRLLIVFILGFSSGLPLALVTSTLQAWFAESGLSVYATGMLSLLGLPYLLRIFWSPILDRFTLFNIGKRRSWILLMQITLLIGFNLMAWLSPLTSSTMMMIIAFILACSSATQDMAIEAHRTEYLLMPEQALGSSLAVFGYRMAMLVSGGLALVLAHYAGWSVAYRIMGCFMLLGMIATIYSPEPSLENSDKTLTSSFVEPLRELWLRPGFISLLLFIFFYKLGESFTTTTSGIVMPFLIQGVGFSLETIGYVNKIMGVGSILVGGLTAGLLLMRLELKKALLIFGLLQALTNILFVLLAMYGKNFGLFAFAVFCDNFAAGLASTALVVLFMRVVDRRFTASQFSLLAAFSTLPRNFSGPVAAFLQDSFGWIGLYEVSVILALGFIPFLFIISSFFNIQKETMPILLSAENTI